MSDVMKFICVYFNEGMMKYFSFYFIVDFF